jgi:hypothetical protein
MSGVFNSKAFKAVWDGLDAETQEAIKAKARWEQMSLTTVTREWWPRVWARVEADPRQQKSVADWETKVAAYGAGKAERAAGAEPKA